jgi:hypothetical protein
MIKKFSELENGEKFKVKEIEYEKIAAVKISCCRSINAKNTSNEQQQIFVTPNQEVETISQ